MDKVYGLPGSGRKDDKLAREVVPDHEPVDPLLIWSDEVVLIMAKRRDLRSWSSHVHTPDRDLQFESSFRAQLNSHCIHSCQETVKNQCPLSRQKGRGIQSSDNRYSFTRVPI